MTLKARIAEKQLSRIIAKLIQDARVAAQKEETVTDNYGDGSEQIDRMR